MRKHSKFLCVLLAMLMVIAILPIKPVVKADAKTLSVYDLLPDECTIFDKTVYKGNDWVFNASRHGSRLSISVSTNTGNNPYMRFGLALDIEKQEIEKYYPNLEIRSTSKKDADQYYLYCTPTMTTSFGPDTTDLDLSYEMIYYSGRVILDDEMRPFLQQKINCMMNFINDEFVKQCCFGLYELGFTNFPANPAVTESNAGKPFSKDDLNAYFNDKSFEYAGVVEVNDNTYNLEIACDSNALTISSNNAAGYKGSISIDFSSNADTVITYDVPRPIDLFIGHLSASAIIPNTYTTDTNLFFVYTYAGNYVLESNAKLNEDANAYISGMLLAADKAIQANSDMSLKDFGFVNFSPKAEPKPDETKDPVTPPTPETPVTPVTPTTPNPTVAPVTPNPVTPAPTTAPTATPEPGLNRFVERLYNVALGRNSEAAGKAYWIDEVKFNGKTASDIAKGFLYSPEFINKSMTNDQLLDTLYQTFFNREPDAAGKAYWLDLMNNGKTKMDVIDGFCNSTEWANLCLTYGVPSGSSATPTITIEPNEGTKAFVTRLYEICLDREPDAKGFEYWTYRIANMQESGSSAAAGFFVSNEFVNKGYNNDAYVTFLYKAILDREPDAAGKDYWLNLMKNGMSRSDVLKGFAASTEWSNICTNYGILK